MILIFFQIITQNTKRFELFTLFPLVSLSLLDILTLLAPWFLISDLFTGGLARPLIGSILSSVFHDQNIWAVCTTRYDHELHDGNIFVLARGKEYKQKLLARHINWWNKNSISIFIRLPWAYRKARTGTWTILRSCKLHPYLAGFSVCNKVQQIC